jgi:hypothetical protein
MARHNSFASGIGVGRYAFTGTIAFAGFISTRNRKASPSGEVRALDTDGLDSREKVFVDVEVRFDYR